MVKIMEFDATFWVAISFIIFFAVLIYFKIPNKINDLLSKMIIDIKKEIDESERLRAESKILLDNAQKKLDSANAENAQIIKDAKDEAERLIIELNDRFHKSSEIKKNLIQSKISQMRENAIFEIKKTSVKIAIDSVKQAITTSVDKSKLETLFEKNLNETKEELKKISS
tara:strand:- start:468 stop:977 length:510 start_codon:yes stop_codon:yes gene_type:complete